MKNAMLKVRKQHVKTAQLIVDSISWDSMLDSYPNADNYNFIELCQSFLELANDRCSFNGDKRNLSVIVDDWIQGLPSEITVPFENYEILEWQKMVGILGELYSEPQAELALSNYWRIIVATIIMYGTKA